MDPHIFTVVGGVALWTVVVPFIWEKIRSRRDRKAPVPEPKVMDVGQESVNYTPLTPELVKEAVRVNGFVSSFLEFTFANLCVSLCHYVGIVNDISQRHAELYTEMVNTPEETREEPKQAAVSMNKI